MKIIAEYQGEEILLKNYNSYLSLDKTLSLFESKDHLQARLDLDLDEDRLFILNNNESQIPYNASAIRATLSFFEQGKGEDFVNWIYDSATTSDNWKSNANKLSVYFITRINMLDNEEKANPESNRLKKIVRKIKSNLEMFRCSPEALKDFKNDIVPYINEYVKKNGVYDYSYMRKFVSELVNDGYVLNEPNITLREINENEQEKVIDELRVNIDNNNYSKKQISFDDLSSNDNAKKLHL